LLTQGVLTSRIAIRVLLWFWAIWFSVVSASNATDALLAAGLLPAGSRFASGNFDLVSGAIAIYSLSRTWAAVLFALVLIVEVVGSVLFWRAALEPSPARIQHPFLVGISLFCAFLVFDELLLVYRRFPNLETTHFTILTALLLSMLLVRASGQDRA
jgi:hypothetical protein